MITICLVYFKGLTLANLAASLYSVRQQSQRGMKYVKSIVVVDNGTPDSPDSMRSLVAELLFPTRIPVTIRSFKHSDPRLTHSWSTNVAVTLADSTWVLFTRADYLLDPLMVDKFAAQVHTREYDHMTGWDGFITSNGSHLDQNIEEVEAGEWRLRGPNILRGREFDYTSIDSGVWMARKETVERVGGLDERLTAWGHAQTEFQWRVHRAGVEFVRIPEVMFWHPSHGYEAPKDIDLANAQLAAIGGPSLQEMWKRYHGVSPYGQ